MKHNLESLEYLLKAQLNNAATYHVQGDLSFYQVYVYISIYFDLSLSPATTLPANYIGSTKNHRRQVDLMLILCLFNGLCRVGRF